MNTITLKCFNCGNELDVLVESLPTFAFELVEIANNSGMFGVLDFKNNRALVFCDVECCDSNKNKRNSFRIK